VDFKALEKALKSPASVSIIKATTAKEKKEFPDTNPAISISGEHYA
jgi:hypothetical protein